MHVRSPLGGLEVISSEPSPGPRGGHHMPSFPKGISGWGVSDVKKKNTTPPPTLKPSLALPGLEAPGILKKKKCQDKLSEIVVYVKFLCLIS